MQAALSTLTLLLMNMHYEKKCLLDDNIASFKTNYVFLCRKLACGYCHRELKATGSLAALILCFNLSFSLTRRKMLWEEKCSVLIGFIQ